LACRYYDWAWITIDPGQPGQRWPLIHHNRTTKELAGVAQARSTAYIHRQSGFRVRRARA
jgi:hypothetical protein